MSPRPWILVAGTAVVATAATIAAVNLTGSSGAPEAGPSGGGTTPAVSTPRPTPTARTGTPSPSPTTVGVDGPAPAVPVYYVSATARGPRLYREFHAATGTDALQQAVSDAVGRADDPDYHSGWPAGTTVTASVGDGAITLDLGSSAGSLAPRPAGTTPDQAKAALQQLVHTAQAATRTTAPVQFTLDGKVSDTVLGEPTLGATERGKAADVLGQVWVVSPGNGATVPSTFEVTGLAAAFEATVQWELKRGDAVVRKGFTTAQQCCVMAPYSFTVHAPAGRYTLVVHDTDASGDGAPLWQDTKEITVR